jgi:putative copper export protein/mono/diheme cytochrome c family protein/peroxiredoxin
MTDLLIAARAVHFAAAVLLFGGFVFLVSVARPAFLGTSEAVRAERIELHRRLIQIAAWGLAAFIVSDLLWLAVQSANLSAVPLGSVLHRETLGTVLGETLFGRVWRIRFGLAIVLAVVVTQFRKQSGDRDWAVLGIWGIALAGGLLASLAWTGHAAAGQGNDRTIHLSADAAHLIAAGGWIGALPLLVLLLARNRHPTLKEGFDVTVRAIRRFSALGIVCVGGLLISGMVNSWYLVGNVPALLGTDYGRLLLLKIAAFAMMVALATVNRVHWSPQLLVTTGVSSSTLAASAVRGIWRNAMIEIALGTAIVGMVGVLGISIAAAHEQPVWPFPYTLSWGPAEESITVLIILVLAGAGALLALAYWVFGIIRHKWRIVTTGLAGLAGASALCGWLLSVPAYPSTYFRSPVRYATASISRGAAQYMENCVTCHGPDGYGDGPVAASLAVKPANLTEEHLFHHREGELYWWLSHGIPGTPMPGFGSRMSEPQLWDVMNFLRAQAEAETQKTMNGSVEPWRPVVAPDFTFQIDSRPQESLKGQRGHAIVLLVIYTLPESLARLRALTAARHELDRAGVRVIAVALDDQTVALQGANLRDVDESILAAPDLTIAASYALFRRTESTASVPPVPAYMEFLIDRQGYLRARWMQGQKRDGDQLRELLRQIEVLNHEHLRAPAPDGHRH